MNIIRRDVQTLKHPEQSGLFGEFFGALQVSLF
jgi:hypothetical protein